MSDAFSLHATQLVFGPLNTSGFEKLMTAKYPDARFVIITDENVSAHWSEFLVTQFDFLNHAEIIEIPAGEEHKTLDICHSVWEALSEYEISRNDVIINLGGGMVSDLGGFVASAFKRGINFVQIPTSLLAQVDASIGGKTGIDLGPHKNQIGYFAQPDFVFIDSGFLTTLPEAELLSGFAEMLKHGLIADQGYWQDLTQLNPSNLELLLPFIERSVKIKKQVVEEDFHEKGLRKILNFGHTVGHALEGYFLEVKPALLHGHAVGLGMISEAYISLKKGLISESEYREIKKVLFELYGNSLRSKPDSKSLLKLMRNDKKNVGHTIQFCLLDGVGNACYDQEVSDALIEESLQEIG